MPVCVLINSVLATEKFLLINNMTGAHDGRGHTMEGGTRWKGAHDGRGHTMKGGTRWKGAHDGRGHTMEGGT